MAQLAVPIIVHQQKNNAGGELVPAVDWVVYF
jgi:hypothetical protein